MNELIEEALPVVNRLSPIVFRFGFVRIEEARDRRVAVSIGMDQLKMARKIASTDKRRVSSEKGNGSQLRALRG